MEFSKLAGLFSRLDPISGRLEMTSIVSEFLVTVEEAEIETVTLFLRGRVFPAYDPREIGVAEKLMIKALSDVSGKAQDDINTLLRETGDIGLVAEKVLVSKSQTTLFTETLTLEKVRENLVKLSQLEGKGSMEKKLAYIKELLSRGSPVENKFIVRLTLGELRLGVGDGIIRDAISHAWEVPKELVENAFNLRCNIGEVALIVKREGVLGLESISMNPGRPVRVMLAQKAESLSKVLEKFGIIQAETKYDGARVQVHKSGDEIQLFTRRLENVTKQFPEIVKMCRENISCESCIIEGEIVAVQDIKTHKPLAFQHLSRRIKRKYDIAEIMKKIPVEVNFFDLIYLDGEMKTQAEFSERRRLLEDAVTETGEFRLSKMIVTEDEDEIMRFYQESLDLGHEGVMLKVLDAPYKPGSRVGYMYKLKPVMETLDLVLTGATWGEGRRANWLGSYLLSAYDNETGDFLEIGRMATGFSDEQLAEMTDKARQLIISTKGTSVTLRPQIVVEVAYEEIQKSPTYSSGYALRFPRLVRVREDKSVDDADTLNRVLELSGKA